LVEIENSGTPSAGGVGDCTESARKLRTGETEAPQATSLSNALFKIKSEFHENVIELDQSTPLSFFDVAIDRAMFKRVAAFDPHQCDTSHHVNDC